jgi:hypothetical protein
VCLQVPGTSRQNLLAATDKKTHTKHPTEN